MHIKAVNTLGKWAVFIDGKKYSMKDAAPLIHSSYAALYAALNAKTGEELKAWFDMSIWKVQHNISRKAHVFTNPNGERCAICLLQECISISTPGARHRLSRWATGAMDADELFSPTYYDVEDEEGEQDRVYAGKTGANAQWGGLTQIDRSANLNKIASPTSHEKAL